MKKKTIDVFVCGIICVASFVTIFSGCKKNPSSNSVLSDISSRTIHVSSAFYRNDDTLLCFSYIFDRKQDSDKESYILEDNSKVILEDFQEHFYVENDRNPDDRTYCSYRAYSNEPCLAFFFSLDLNKKDNEPISYQDGSLVFNNRVIVDYRNHIVKLLDNSYGGIEKHFPLFDGKIYLLTPELDFQPTDLKVLDIYSYHLFCGNHDRKYIDHPPSLVLDNGVFFENVDFGSYRNSIFDQKWFQAILPELDENSISGLSAK